MKKIKILASAVALIAVVGSVVAFAPASKNLRNLFQIRLSDGVCITAPATSVNTGTTVTPATGFDGWYPNAQCNTQKVAGFQPNAE